VKGAAGLKATPTLTAWGLRGGDAWQDDAACANPDYDPEMWHAAGDSYISSAQYGLRLAVHICWTHCPVRRKCYSEYKGMVGAVVGGVLFDSHGRRGAQQPHATSCNKCISGATA
jgi:hypothetical protein